MASAVKGRGYKCFTCIEPILTHTHMLQFRCLDCICLVLVEFVQTTAIGYKYCIKAIREKQFNESETI